MENRGGNRRIGDYEVIRRLGVGGMGEVLLVRHSLTGRVEAMKVLLPNYVGNRQRQERFLREIQTVAKLEHPNIARLCTAATHEDQIVMVMDYVDGSTVESMIEDKPLPIGKAVRYMTQALSALAYAHSQGIIHRDFKPANLMVTTDGTVKLMDFGIALSEGARLTQNGSTIGTFYFMSPEQARGDDVDGRSDIYAAGVTLYEMLTGRPPFQGTSPSALMEKHINAMPPAPIDFRQDLPPELNNAILKMLAKSPDDRYQTADEAREAIEAAMPGRAITQDEEAVARRTTVTETPAWKDSGAAAERERPVTSDERVGAFDPGIRKVEPAQPAVPPKGALVMKIAAAAAVVVGVSVGVYALMHQKQTSESKPVVAVVDPKPVVVPPQPKPGETGGQGSDSKSVVPSDLRKLKENHHEPVGPNVPPSPPKPKPNPPGNGGETPSKPGDSNDKGGVAGNVPTLTQAQKDQLQHIELELDSVEGRALATDGAVNAKKSQMAAMGLQMRSDVVAEQLSMNNSRIKARAALVANDADRANQYLAQEKVDLQKLETFLGR